MVRPKNKNVHRFTHNLWYKDNDGRKLSLKYFCLMCYRFRIISEIRSKEFVEIVILVNPWHVTSVSVEDVFVDPILLEEVNLDFACDFIQLNNHTNVMYQYKKQHAIEHEFHINYIQCIVAEFLSFWGVKCVCELWCVIEHYAARPSSLLRKNRVVSVWHEPGNHVGRNLT